MTGGDGTAPRASAGRSADGGGGGRSGTGVLSPLRHPAFRALALGRSLMYLGNGMASVALAFAVLDTTGSLVNVGLVVGARSLANVCLLLLGGVIADRLPRSLVLRGGCALAAGSQGLLALTLLTGASSLPLMVGLSLLNGAAGAANLPAAAALTPQTVPPWLLRPANAMLRVGTHTGMFAGAALGGVVVGAAGAGWAIAADAALFTAAGVAFVFLRVPDGTGPQGTEGAEGAGVLRDLAEGWSEFTARRWVWIVVAQFMVVNASWTASVSVLGPAIADTAFGRTEWGLLMAVNAVGLLVGGALAARWQPNRALLFGVALILVQTVPLYALSLQAPLLPLLAAMFVAGVAVEQFGVAWEVSVQENVPPDRLSRVYSYDALGSFVAMPAGSFVAGPLAERIGAQASVALLASLTVAATLAAIASPSVRNLRRR
ncbi:MFS transporter [Nocardiopsis sp. FIRDI 009]|uniref:MFS transporter n=1 Tax=Nocardiopsis sp. FIRDI 009 TaxID=714197 RepID=UPI000E2634E1|nr:MFS transporter [Nocardiopsis sp. FIRDI 009]